jgi:hypothetical protein
MFVALVLVLVAGCPQSPGGGAGPGTGMRPTPGSGSAPGTGSGSGTPTAGEERPKLGEPCAANDVCGEGTCVKYYGIAGPRGGEFKSCEIRCDADGRCEGSRKCITVADGPGQVCR